MTVSQTRQQGDERGGHLYHRAPRLLSLDRGRCYHDLLLARGGDQNPAPPAPCLDAVHPPAVKRTKLQGGRQADSREQWEAGHGGLL